MYDIDVNRKAMSPSPYVQSPIQTTFNSPDIKSGKWVKKLFTNTRVLYGPIGQMIDKMVNLSPSTSFKLNIKKPVMAKSKIVTGALPNININKSKFK